MPSIDGWLTNAFPLSGWLAIHDEAVDTALVISDKTTSITVRRAGSNLSAQTVRIEALGTPSERQGENATVGTQAVLVLGYKGHPTITDTDLKRGDRFFVSGETMLYTVTQILPDLRNSLQAIAVVGQGA